MDLEYYLNEVKPLVNYSLLNPIDEMSGRLGWLGYSAVNQVYNESYSGLCLSAEEGGMHASMEYLLSGLPIVTTRSRGGRDFFFNEVNSVIVEDEATSVAIAVANNKKNYSIERAKSIRAQAIKAQEAVQTKFKKFILDIINTNGINLDIDRLWKVIYRDKFITMSDVDKFILDDLSRISKY